MRSKQTEKIVTFSPSLPVATNYAGSLNGGDPHETAEIFKGGLEDNLVNRYGVSVGLCKEAPWYYW